MNFRLRHLLFLTLVSLQTMIPLVGAATYGPHPYWDADNNVYDLGGIPLRINSGAIIGSGNLGIGVLNPGYRVDVDGYINSSSGFCINGNCVDDWGNIAVWNKDINTGTIYYTGGIVQIGTDIVPKGGTNIGLSISGSIAMEAYRFLTYQSIYDSIGIGNVALNQDSNGSSNIAIGKSSLGNNTIGERNIAIGSISMSSNLEGSYNIGIGETTLYLNDYGNSNIAMGDQAMYNNLNGNSNIAIGRNSLRTNAFGNENVAIGLNALYNTDTSQNTAVGYQSLYSNQSISNTAVGWNALYANTTGYANSAIGWNVMSRNIDGVHNVAFGENALIFNENGNYNTALGNAALGENISGSYNIGIGYMADVATGNLDNAIAIGYRSYVTASNTLVLGGINGINGATSDTQVVIGDTEAGTGNLDEHYALDVQNGYINSIDGLCIDGDCKSAWSQIGGSLASGTTIGNTLRWTGTGWSDSDWGDILVKTVTVGQGSGDGEGSTALGYNALANNITGQGNTAIGAQALSSNISGYGNVAVGERGLFANDSGFQNTALGNRAGSNLISGDNNIAIGYNTNFVDINGSNQLNIGNWIYGSGGYIGIGTSDPQSALDVNGDIAIKGVPFIRYLQGDGEAIAIGANALPGDVLQSNLAVGNSALRDLMGYESDNTAIGFWTLSSLLNGEGNTAIGSSAGSSSIGYNGLTTGEGNTFIGYGATAATGGINFSAAIGARSLVSASNTIVLGAVNGVNLANWDTQVVIGDTEAGTGNAGERYHLDVQNGYINSSNGLCIDGDCITGWAGLGGGSLPTATSTGNTLRWTGTGWSDSEMGDIMVNGVTIGKGVNSMDNNTVLGREALASNPGDWNTAIGTYALRSSLQNWNTAVGYAALYQNTYGYENTAIGHSSLVNNTTGIGNVSLGFYTLGMNQVGGGNVAIGNMALGYQENGNNNVALGGVALLNNGSGSNNLGIGYKADVGISDLINASAIGPYAYVSASNTMVLGSVNGLNGATADTQVVIGSDSAGVGNNSEIYRLDVQRGYINTSSGLCMNGDCKSSWSQVASSRYPGCSRDDIQLANGQIWAGCDVYNGGYYLYQHGEMTAWNFSTGTTSQNNAITLAGIAYRSSSIGTVGYSGWSSVVADTRSGTYDKTWYGTPGDDTGPCAPGYHVPSNLNWNNAYTELGSDRNTFVNTLFLTTDYYRSAVDGSIVSDGSSYYWSSTISGSNNAIATVFDSTTVNTYSFQDRANAYKIRCLKDNTDIAE